MAKGRQESQCEVTYSEGEDSVNALLWEPLSRLLKVNKRYCQQNRREASNAVEKYSEMVPSSVCLLSLQPVM